MTKREEALVGVVISFLMLLVGLSLAGVFKSEPPRVTRIVPCCKTWIPNDQSRHAQYWSLTATGEPLTPYWQRALPARGSSSLWFSPVDVKPDRWVIIMNPDARGDGSRCPERSPRRAAGDLRAARCDDGDHG